MFCNLQPDNLQFCFTDINLKTCRKKKQLYCVMTCFPAAYSNIFRQLHFRGTFYCIVKTRTIFIDIIFVLI